MKQAFSLVPFRDIDVPDVKITGTVSRQNNFLTIGCALTGKVEEVLLPALSAAPARKDDLWRATCFEFFLAVNGLPQYWEFNLSPSRDWNIYRMDAYRRVGFREEARILQLPFEVQKDTHGLRLVATVDLSPIVAPEQGLEMGIAAVIQAKEGGETYWALIHPAPQPDFHLRESFILALAG